MRIPVHRCAALILAMHACLVQAQEPLHLRQAFAQAWARQPEAHGGELRRAAADARRETADSWLAAPPNLELAAKSDRFNRNEGVREYDAGIGLPLWLPGERSGAQALAEAERAAIDSRLLAAQLRLAAVLREAWWSEQQAVFESDIANARLKLAEQLAADVARRVRAGDLARADQHQADGAVATAQAQAAEADSLRAQTRQRLRAVLGSLPRMDAAPESMPPPGLDEARHPALREIEARADVARRARALAATQTRANPQLTLGTVRERDSQGDAYGQSLTVGVRIPFGSDSRQRARMNAAEADALEADAQLALEREQVLGAIEAGRMRVDAARIQLDAAERRARLARETRGFFDKSFRLGESDLPTRLRVDLEAYEAERQHARSRIALAQAISQLRQALGLLPE